MDYILVGIGGFFGAVARFEAGRLLSRLTKSSFPLGTFTVNILGAFLLGIVSSLDPGKNTYLLIGDGFLGAFTTFSTFMYEGFNLFKERQALNAATYISLSILLGIGGFILGTMIVK